MNEFNLTDLLLQKFSTCIERMEVECSGEDAVAEHENEKLYLKVFSSAGDTESPIEKISLMILENGKVKNKDDKSTLDTGTFTTATIIPKDGLPIPMCALEGSYHFGKYIQVRAEIPPLSTNADYRETFCKPVQDLRGSLENLPGLSPMTSLPGLEEYSSGGLMAGHLAPEHMETALRWFSDYIELYLGFVRNRDAYTVLQDPAIISEGKSRKEGFCRMFAKMTPAILSDLPNLYSDELAGRLGGLLF